MFVFVQQGSSVPWMHGLSGAQVASIQTNIWWMSLCVNMHFFFLVSGGRGEEGQEGEGNNPIDLP